MQNQNPGSENLESKKPEEQCESASSGEEKNVAVEEKAVSTEEKPVAADENVNVLADKLADTEKQLAEMKDAFLRAKAESENIRKRAQEDIAKAHKFAVESFAQSMLAVKDSLEMVVKTDAPTIESIKSGVDATLRQLKQVFEQNRISEVVPEQGAKLDPLKHQAIQTVESEQDGNTVVSVLQKGYTLSDRLLRPAFVVVAATKKA